MAALRPTGVPGIPWPQGRVPLLCLLLGWAAGSCAPTGGETPVPAPPGAAADAAPAPLPEPPPIEAGRAPPPGPYAPGVDVLHYDVELSLPGEESVIRGRARLRIRLEDPVPDTLALDLTGLGVDGVRVGGAPVRARLREGRLLVPLEGERADGQVIEVEVAYGGTPDDGLVLGRTVHGAPSAFADNWPNRARFWFPSVDHPSDKATVRFTVHAPARWRVVANGRPGEAPAVAPSLREGEGPATATTVWETDVPIPTYTMVVGGTDMVVRSVGRAACGQAPRSPREDGCVDVTWWVFPPDTAHAARVFRRAARMVDVFTDMVGPFPYEKLANVQSSTRFGGMENASAIFYSEAALSEERDFEGTVAHEIAHQWFGDSVTEADWHHLWLSEGFATYFGALFYERVDGPEAFRARMEANRRRYVGSDVTDRPVVDPSEDDLFDLLNANNYPKGAWVLHTLRGVLGNEAFFRGIRLYYERHRDGTALTADFRAAMEETSGLDLGWFFHQWIFEPGYPMIRLEHEWDDGAREVRVTVHQEQPEDWPTFRLPAEIALRHAGGETREEVEVTDRRQTFRFALPAPPSDVVFDPDARVLKDTVPAGGS